MWKQIRPALVILSVASNVAFVGVWIAFAAVSGVESHAVRCEPGDSTTVWCPLHRQLNVTADQWKEIEPRLRAFRASADEICRQITELRSGIIDQLAAANPDLDAVEAKQGEILGSQRQMQSLVIDQLMAEKEVLTHEQQHRLFTMLRSGTGFDRGGPMLVPGRGHEGGIGQVLRTGGDE
ncbi:MAG: Spy/CpxP family protein refolding chaperone [Planctomycetota bacterium]